MMLDFPDEFVPKSPVIFPNEMSATGQDLKFVKRSLRSIGEAYRTQSLLSAIQVAAGRRSVPICRLTCRRDNRKGEIMNATRLGRCPVAAYQPRPPAASFARPHRTPASTPEKQNGLRLAA